MFHFGERIDYFPARDYFTANPGVGAIDGDGTLADTLSSDYDVQRGDHRRLRHGDDSLRQADDRAGRAHRAYP